MRQNADENNHFSNMKSISIAFAVILFTTTFISLNNMVSAETTVQVMDVSRLHSEDVEERKALAVEIGKVCEDIGFLVITGHGVNQDIIDNMWNQTREFFDLPEEEKDECTRPQHIYPFGYIKMLGEVLSRGKSSEKTEGDQYTEEDEAPADLKETFSLGPDDPETGFGERVFPRNPVGFRKAWEDYYNAMNDLAGKLMRSFALALNLEETYFEKFIDHQASALRAINYPHLEGVTPLPGQQRAGAHTDYGTVTILRVDAPGLQVSKDKENPNWVDVPFVPGAYIINLGDLIKRWTNDHWASTLHRVVNADPKTQDWAGRNSTRRQSVAFFHNLNRDALVENLIQDEEAKHEPIIAGDFLMQKYLASTGYDKPKEHEKSEL
eukprot:TRINITY_DN1704_c0_g1_i1.p1 TRINITY_DN1704_c0_g1~~TRINITY_DN1704_c0_g1_i1.p1  ORF type:complete len:381 (-),score=128.72 TRINITY_DN1704_c0_g1_i1:60-1202(-)